MSRRLPRIALAIGILAGLVTLVAVPRFLPEQVGVATDVYYGATQTWLEGGDPYAYRPPDHPAFGFLYPPLVLLAFVPHVLTGSAAGAFLLQSLLNVLTASALAVVLVRAIERGGVELARLDRGLVWGYVFLGVGGATSFLNGQVNLQLALAIALGALWLERGEDIRSGVALSLAALVKVVPAVTGLWLLRQRAWRATAAAIASGLGLLLAGVVVGGPDLLGTYLTDVLTGEAAAGSFPDGPDPGSPYVTIRRPLVALASWIPPAWRLPVGVLLIAPFVLAGMRSVATYRARLVALAGVLVGTLALVPLEPFYVVLATFPLVPLVYLLDPGHVRAVYLVGFVIVSVPIRMTGVENIAPLLPAGLEGVVLDMASSIFRVVLPPAVGFWVLLGACVLFQYRTPRDGVDGAVSAPE